MTTFQAFDNLDDMLQAMEDSREAADARVKAWQSAVKPGDLILLHNGECICYCLILDPIAEEKKAGADAAELAYAKRLWAEPHMEHYRFAKTFSIYCPDGELGDIHVSQVQVVLPAKIATALLEAGDNWPATGEELHDRIQEILGH